MIQLTLPDPMPKWPSAELRSWRPTDADRLVEAWTDPEIVRWNPVPSDPSRARALSWIDGIDHRLVRGQSLDLCIAHHVHRGRDGGARSAPSRPIGELVSEVVGEVGLSGFDHARRTAMVGYWLLPRARGNGHATAALHALTAHGFNLGFMTLIARCASQNLASQAVARRAGFVCANDDGSHQLWVVRAGKAPCRGTT